MKVGIFLGRMQPLTPGHEWLIENIFKHNQEVVICIGSAEQIAPDDPKAAKNPLPTDERFIRVEAFIKRSGFDKPYRILKVADVDSDAAWPVHLAREIGLDAKNTSNIYFGDKISDDYKKGLEAAGFTVRIVKRKRFEYEAPNKKIYEFQSATEVRKLNAALGTKI